MTIAATTGAFLGFNIEAIDTCVQLRIITRTGAPLIDAKVKITSVFNDNEISKGNTDNNGEVFAKITLGQDNRVIVASGTSETERFRIYQWLVHPFPRTILPEDTNFPLLITNSAGLPIENAKVTIYCDSSEGVQTVYTGLTNVDGLFSGQYDLKTTPRVVVTMSGYQTLTLEMDALLTSHYPDSDYIAIPKLELQQ